jgi:DNA repair exonuclease SbcCD nuclease subunit
MIGLITDTHIGARSSSSIFREYMKWWYENSFFPVLKDNDVKYIVHAGDFFDARNAITLQDIDFVINWFAKQLIVYDIRFIVVLGNHDVAFKNSNRIHSLSILKAAAPNHVTVIEEPRKMIIDNQDYVLVPWINNENYDSTLKFLNDIENKKDVIVIGHFEINGMKMYKHSPLCEGGLDQSLFKEFKEVWSGHFHHRSKVGNIRYLGSLFHLNWEDYGDDRGFHIYDSDINNLTFLENKDSLFLEFEFNYDILKDVSDDELKSWIEGRFIRLYVLTEYEKVHLLDTISRINKCKPHNLQIINEFVLKQQSKSVDDDVIEDRATKSTHDYIIDYVKEKSTFVREYMDNLFKRAEEQKVVGE